jgi:hypothetical protein
MFGKVFGTRAGVRGGFADKFPQLPRQPLRISGKIAEYYRNSAHFLRFPAIQ